MSVVRIGLLVCMLTSFSAAASGAEPLAGAYWVWSSADANVGDQGPEPRFLRHTLELPAAPAAASLVIAVDNQCEAFVNGQSVGKHDSWQSPKAFDVAARLVKGRNVVAVRAVNSGGPAGVLIRLEATLPDKSKVVFGSNSKWRLSLAADENWNALDFNDSKWVPASVLGDASIGPWSLAQGPASGGNPDKNISNPKITSYRPASEEFEQFVLPEGFQIELVVSEPTIINPVCITHDERGRLYVSESHTYRFGPGGTPLKGAAPNPIVRLDPLPDGKGFRRVLVAEGFDDPVMGMAIRGNRLWAAANNYLYRFDLDDSQLAQTPAGAAVNAPIGVRRETLLIDKNKAWNPFGMFVLEWGPEGDLYLSVGDHNINIYRVANEKERLSGRGSSGIVMRMSPDGERLERLVTGMRVPYGYDYDPFGQLWLLSNGEGNPNRFMRVIEGVDYFYQARSNDWLGGKHPLAPPCFELPRGACTQLLRYYGANFPASYQGSLLLDNWGAHGFGGPNRTIFRYVPNERNEIETKEEFVLCKDPHFRCSHVLYDRDGSLLIADWYGRDDESDLTGRVWRVRYTGSDRPVVKHHLNSPEWKNPAYAIEALGSPDHLVRHKAVETLTAVGPAAVPLLAEHAGRAVEPLGAAQALWTLARIGSGEAQAAFAGGVKHADWRVRRLALNLLRRYAVSTRDAQARGLANDPDPAVRLAAALALSKPADRLPALLAVLRGGAAADAHLRYETAWHLADLVDEAALSGLLQDKNADVALAGMIVIDLAAFESRPTADLALAALGRALAQPGTLDYKLLLELAQLHPSPKLTEELRRLASRADVPPAVAGQALLILRARGGSPQSLDAQAVRRFLQAAEAGEVATQTTGDVATVLELLLAQSEPTPYAEASATRWLNHTDGRVRELAHRLARQLGPRAAGVADALWGRVLNAGDKRPAADRLTELATLFAVDRGAKGENWTRLLEAGDSLLVTDAVRSWRQYSGDGPRRTLLLEASSKLRARFPELDQDLAAVAAAEKSPDDAWRNLKLPSLPADDAAYRLALPPEEPNKDQEALGRRVFERVGCVKCHTTVTAPTERAPSLVGVSKGQKIEYLVESVLEPSKIIKTGFETENVVSKAGKIYNGMVKDDGDHLRILSADREDRVPKSEIDERTVLKKSLMPEGQHRGLSRREFADLIAYLRSLK